MPFSSSRFPSMQIGLLQSILAERGISATAHYLNLEFAARIGWNLYEALSNTPVFRRRLDVRGRGVPEDVSDPLLFLKRYGAGPSARNDWSGFGSQRKDGAREFSGILPVASVPWHQYDVIGSSSVFVQNVAALALRDC